MCALVSREWWERGKIGSVVRWSVHVCATFEYIAHVSLPAQVR